MSLPAPTAAFTITSLHDDLELDCRLYYPRKSPPTGVGQAFAILAHPYAPLGGSFDDGVVALVGSVLLRNGIFLGTFNFRGAAGSPGRTSWSGKAELGDYVAFYAFMLCYIDAIRTQMGQSDESPGIYPEPLLILGGYSYGSMIASCLPPIELVQELVNGTIQGSTEYEIRSRAVELAKDYVAFVELHRQGSLKRDRNSLRVSDGAGSPGRVTALGGYESEAASRRISREASRRSFDGERVKHSIDRARQKLMKRGNSDHDANSSVSSTPFPTPQELVSPRIAYLLVSPLLPPVSTLIMLSAKPSFERQIPGQQSLCRDSSAKEDKFLNHPTCFIYGGKDGFTASKKITKWTDDLRSRTKSSFSSYEVESAGHFWTEAGSSEKLKSSVGEWLATILQPISTSALAQQK